MKKQEYQELLKTGVELVEQEQYGEAVRIFDSLNLDGIRSPGILQRVAKAYERSQRYMDAEDILLQAHQAAPKSRGTLYHLTLIALKANEPGSAESYYRKFCDVAGHDPMRFALQYRIARAKGAPDSELIRILENYRDEEPDDRWMYELARLYATNGRTQEAVEVCDTILVWYNSGKYWERAREMKAAITGIEPEPLPSETEAYAAEAIPAAVLPAAALASTRDVFAGTDEALAAAIRATEEEIIGGAEETRGEGNVPAEEDVPAEAVPAEENVPAETVPAEEGVSAETVPAEENVSAEAVPAEEDVPAEAAPVEENVPAEAVPVEEGVSAEEAPALETAYGTGVSTAAAETPSEKGAAPAREIYEAVEIHEAEDSASEEAVSAEGIAPEEAGLVEERSSEEAVPAEEPVPEEEVSAEETASGEKVPAEGEASEQVISVGESVSAEAIPTEENVAAEEASTAETVFGTAIPTAAEETPSEEGAAPAREIYEAVEIHVAEDSVSTETGSAEGTAPEEAGSAEESSSEEAVSVEETVPEEVVPAEEDASERVITAGETVSGETVPAEEDASERVITAGETVSEEAGPAEEEASEQIISTEESTAGEAFSGEETDSAEALPAEEGVVAEALPAEENAPAESPVAETVYETAIPAAAEETPVPEAPASKPAAERSVYAPSGKAAPEKPATRPGRRMDIYEAILLAGKDLTEATEASSKEQPSDEDFEQTLAREWAAMNNTPAAPAGGQDVPEDERITVYSEDAEWAVFGRPAPDAGRVREDGAYTAPAGNASAPEDENRTASSETSAVSEDGLTFTISYGGIGNLDAEPEDEVEAELEALAEAKRQEEENAETAPEPPAGSAADERYAQPETEEKTSEAAEAAAAPGMPEAESDRPGTAEADTAPEPPETEADEHVMMTVTNASSAVLREREKMAAAAARGQEMPAEGGASYGEAAEDTLAGDGEAAQQEAETEGTEAPAEPAKPEMPDEVDLFAGFEDHSKEIRRKLEQRAARSARLGRLPLEADVSKDVWHFMVFGDRDEQTLECAREKMQEIGVISTNAPRKMLKLRAERIGNANIVQSLDRFLGNMVIVEHASALTDEQLQDFAKVLDKDDRSLLIAFTDTEPHLEELFLRVPELANSFTAVYEGKMLTVEDLISEVKEFLFHNDALLTEDGEAYVAAFAQRTMTEGKGFYKSTMRKLAAKALRAAERGGFLGLSMGKVDEDGYLLVSEKYFRRVENQ